MTYQDSEMPSATSNSQESIPPEVSARGKSAVEMYARLRSEGLSPQWCEMVVLQQPPGVKGTDRSYMQGRYNNQQLDAMPPDHARNIVTLAKRAGISISGKYYSAGLADGRGPADPSAWVDSTADVVRVAKARNLTVTGAVEHRGTPVPPTRKPLSERITKELMREERKRHPGMKKGELREMVVSKYGRKRQ